VCFSVKLIHTCMPPTPTIPLQQLSWGYPYLCASLLTLVTKLGMLLPIPQAAIMDIKTTGPTMPSNLVIPVVPDWIDHLRDTHPCYSIFAHGCSNTVYCVISHKSGGTYKFLLVNHNPLDEYPWKDPGSLEAVQLLKSFLKQRHQVQSLARSAFPSKI